MHSHPNSKYWLNNPNVQRTGEIILLEMVIVDVISNFLGCIIVGIGAGEVAASTL